MHKFFVPGVPIAKPRLTKSSHWGKTMPDGSFQYYNKSVGMYFEWSSKCRKAATSTDEKMPLDHPYVGITATFIFPIPNHFSDKKRRDCEGRRMETRPDLDNLLKGVMDSIFHKDSIISSATVLKRYAYEGEQVGALICLLTSSESDIT